jgi:hypothetical protein
VLMNPLSDTASRSSRFQLSTKEQAMSRRSWLRAALILPLVAGRVDAQRLAIVLGDPTYRYPLYYEAVLTSRFGGAVDFYPDLTGAFPGATALLVYMQPTSRTLTSIEATNLSDWIASGKRVGVFGDNWAFATWNGSFLPVLGGTDCSTTAFSNAGGTPLVSHPLTTGITLLQTMGAPGCANGGIQLFSNTFAALFGSTQNALALMDVNTLDPQALQTWPENVRWGDNVADWLYNSRSSTVTPEPATLVLLVPGLVAVVVAARRRTSRSCTRFAGRIR